MFLWLFFILSFHLKWIHSYEMLPDSLLNRTQICQVNCTRNQTMSDAFQAIPHCQLGHFKICEAYLGIDFHTKQVSYSLTTADSSEINTENSTSLRADLVTDYLPYIQTNITAIRFRQLIMKFSKTNPHRLNINYYCRTQIDDCAYQEIETIYPVYIANQYLLKRIQPLFYDEFISFGTKIKCYTDTTTDKTSLCSGYCTVTFNLHTMTKGCNETLSLNTLGINMSLGLAYPNDRRFTAQVSRLVLVCNKSGCNSNASISEAIAIANIFLTAQSIGVSMIINYRSFFVLLWFFCIIKLVIKLP